MKGYLGRLEPQVGQEEGIWEISERKDMTQEQDRKVIG